MVHVCLYRVARLATVLSVVCGTCSHHAQVLVQHGQRSSVGVRAARCSVRSSANFSAHDYGVLVVPTAHARAAAKAPRSHVSAGDILSGQLDAACGSGPEPSSAPRFMPSGPCLSLQAATRGAPPWARARLEGVRERARSRPATTDGRWTPGAPRRAQTSPVQWRRGRARDTTRARHGCGCALRAAPPTT